MNEFEESVFKHSKIDRSFLVIENGEHFPNIENGIVFIFAEWSADSILHFILLTEILSRLDLKNLKIHVLDTDKLNQSDLSQKGISIPQGRGETFWIKNYKVEHFLDSKENDVSKIVSFTTEMFVQ